MADLLTHTCVALLWKAAVSPEPRRQVPVFVAGTWAPDLLGHLPGFVLALVPWVPADAGHLFTPLHLPVGIVLSSLGFAQLFDETERPSVFGSLLGGGFLHLGFDLLQDHLGAGYILLFPFTRWHGELGLIGTERTLDLLPWLVPFTLLAGGWRWRRRREA